MNTKKRETLFFIIMISFSLLGIFIITPHFKLTGNVVSDVWCQGADINRDGSVNQIDYTLFSSYYGKSISQCPNFNEDYSNYLLCTRCDLNEDNLINSADYSIFNANYGETDCVGTTSTTCTETNPTYQCKVQMPGPPEQSCGTTMTYDSTLSCDVGKLCCKPKTTSTTCTETNPTYQCKSQTPGSPEESCGTTMTYDSTLSCDVGKLCCKPKTITPITNPECGLAQTSGLSFTTSAEVITKGTCAKGIRGATGVVLSLISNKWTWTCVNNSITINCNASYNAPATLCSQQGYTCGNINESSNMNKSCASIKMEWVQNETFDISCNSTKKIGCCNQCAYGFNETSNRCYAGKQKCSILGGDKCEADLETCSGTYLTSSDERCCSVTCSVKDSIEYEPTNSELKKGFNVELRKKKDTITFEVADETHELEILEVTKTTAKIKISSDTIETTLEIDEIRKYDLDANGYYDTKIVLDDTVDDDDFVELTLYAINEKITTTTQTDQKTSELEEGEDDNTTSSGNSWYYLVFLIIILIVFVGVLLYLAYRRNH
jgi:hypothetical protein